MKDVTNGSSRVFLITQELDNRKSVVLLIIFIAFWLYSIGGSYYLIGYTDEPESGGNAAQTAADAANGELFLLSNKTAAYERSHAAASSFAASARAGISPLRAASGEENAKLLSAESSPEVTVRAVGFLGKSRVTILDIDNEAGRLMREGDVFGAKGRVLRIDNEGVMWTWGSLRYKSLIWE